jgi:hypothetical protein
LCKIRTAKCFTGDLLRSVELYIIYDANIAYI